MDQKYGLEGSVIIDWKDRHKSVEEKIQSLQAEIRSIDEEFLQVDKQNQARQQRIRELSEEKSKIGLLDVKERRSIDMRITELQSAPEYQIKDAESKIQQKKILQTKLDGLRIDSDNIRKELTRIMDSKQKLQVKIDQKMGMPVLKEVKIIKQKISSSNERRTL